VLLPHLTTLAAGVHSVHKELLRLTSLGWYRFFDDVPFLPLRCSPQGSEPRPHELDRYRRTTDGGGPRRPLLDSSGKLVIPLNVAIGLGDVFADLAAAGDLAGDAAAGDLADDAANIAAAPCSPARARCWT